MPKATKQPNYDDTLHQAGLVEVVYGLIPLQQIPKTYEGWSGYAHWCDIIGVKCGDVMWVQGSFGQSGEQIATVVKIGSDYLGQTNRVLSRYEMTPVTKAKTTKQPKATKGGYPDIKPGDWVTVNASSTIRQVESIDDNLAKLSHGGGTVHTSRLALSSPPQCRQGPQQPQENKPGTNGHEPTCKVVWRHPNGVISIVSLSNGETSYYQVTKVSASIFTMTKLEYQRATTYQVFVGVNKFCACQDFKVRGTTTHPCKHIRALLALVASGKV